MRDSGEVLMNRKKIVIPIGTKLVDAQREIVLSTLDALENNQTRTAAVLGISRMTLYTLLRRYKSRPTNSRRRSRMGARRRPS